MIITGIFFFATHPFSPTYSTLSPYTTLAEYTFLHRNLFSTGVHTIPFLVYSRTCSQSRVTVGEQRFTVGRENPLPNLFYSEGRTDRYILLANKERSNENLSRKYYSKGGSALQQKPAS